MGSVSGHFGPHSDCEKYGMRLRKKSGEIRDFSAITALDDFDYIEIFSRPWMCVATIIGTNQEKGRLVIRIGEQLEVDKAQNILMIPQKDLQYVIKDLFEDFNFLD
jgi:hypothetical protein